VDLGGGPKLASFGKFCFSGGAVVPCGGTAAECAVPACLAYSKPAAERCRARRGASGGTAGEILAVGVCSGGG
jgi:hypothetical protein